MISVIIPTHDSAQTLPDLLADLVPAAVDGIVREVIAADAGSTDATPAICDDAGVSLILGGILAAAATAKGDRLLILPVNMALPADWRRSLHAYVAGAGDPARLRGPRPAGMTGWIAPRLAGLLVHREVLSSQTETRDITALIRALGVSRV